MAAPVGQDILALAVQNDLTGRFKLRDRIVDQRALDVGEHMGGHQVLHRGSPALLDDLVQTLYRDHHRVAENLLGFPVYLPQKILEL